MTGGAGHDRRRALVLRAPVVVLVMVVLVGVALLATSAAKGAMTYYRTPTELATSPPPPGQSVRVGGLVIAGTVHRHAGEVRFLLSDGAQEIEVVTRGTPPSTFQAGQGAVVEGHLTDGGSRFRADQVEVRHSDEYRPPRSKGG